MSSDVTDILEFGSAVSSSSVLARLDIDEQSHLDSDGEPLSQISPADTCKLLFHAEPGVVLKALADTIGGSYGIGATVMRTTTYGAYFETTDDEITLPHYPRSVSASFDGLSGRLVQNGDNPRKIKCSVAPRKCLITYSYSATLCWHKLPSGVRIGLDDAREVKLRARYEYVEK